MRVFFQMSGGAGFFPGLGAPCTIDIEALAGEDRNALKQLVEETKFFELPARIPAPRGFADLRSYEITIEDGGRQHTVALCDPIIPRAMHRLIIRLRELAVSTYASFPHR
jgi:hypothetical protein